MGLIFLKEEGLEDIAQHSEERPLILLKYSNSCGTSERTLERAKEFIGAHPDAEVLVLTVQENRDLSREIEMRYGIEHESPQAIVLFKDAPLYYESHAAINFEKIERVIREADILL